MKKLLLTLFLCLFCSVSKADVTTGLVGWWKLIDGSGTTCLDSSGNANTGTTHNGPTWVAGKIGSFALNFVTASNTYMNTATATNIPNISAAQTLSAWVNAGGAGTSRDIVVPELNGSGANQLRINAANNAEVSQWGGGITITAGAVGAGTWHMLTWTHSTGPVVNTIYIDGVQSGATNATATQVFAPTAVLIGAYGAGAGNENFQGSIDDVRIYNRALTAADVSQLFQYTGKGLYYLMSK